ncbi:Plexin-B [Halotydeus destructor]|nr:Plexin-B [Halotydeus destructor]
MGQRWLMVSLLVLCTNHLYTCASASVTYTYYKDEEPSIVASFSTASPTINLTHMTIDPSTGRIYVGASNWLYQFTADLKLDNQVQTGPIEDGAHCSPSDCTGIESHLVRSTNNINKVLVIDGDSRMLIVCGSVRQGSCRRHQLDNITYQEPAVGMPVAANDENSSTVAFIGPARYDGDSLNVLYVAATNSRLGSYRDMVPAISSRYLDSGPKLFNIIETSFTDTGRVDISHHVKDYFLVKYIYGFHSNDFVYFATVQRKSYLHALEEWGFVTRLARVCSSDAGFHSYTEITISCSSQGTDYNLLQDAYVTKVDGSLADSLRLRRGSDVLVGAFVASKDHSMKVSSRSAVCLFPLVDIEQKFEENIKMCYNGTLGSRNMNYIAGSVDECPQVGKAGNVVNFCHETLKLNGSLPLLSQPVIAYNDATLTAITAVSSKNLLTAFLGTSDGTVKKIAIARQADQVDEVVVDKGHSILADMHVDRDKRFVYALSRHKVSKIKVERQLNRTSAASSSSSSSPSSSSSSSSAASTMTARRNASSSSSKETVRVRPASVHERSKQQHQQRAKEAASSESPYMSRHDGGQVFPAQHIDRVTEINNIRPTSWPSTEQDERLRQFDAAMSSRDTDDQRRYGLQAALGPRFGEIRPSALSISAHDATIELTVQHLPFIAYPNSYLCFFGTKSIPIQARSSVRGLYCSTPPYQHRPQIPLGQDHVAVNLTVRSSLPDSEFLLERPFVFYDCGRHRTCGTCVTSAWDCNWCVIESECTSNASSCSSREAIVGDRSPERSLVRGVDNCPSSKSGAEEILVTDNSGPEVAIDGIYRNWLIGLITAAGGLFLILSFIMLVMSRLNARGFLRGHGQGVRMPLGTHLRRQHGWLHESPAEVPVQSWNYFGRGDPQFERNTLKPCPGNPRPVLSLTEDVGRYTLVRLQPPPPPLVDVRHDGLTESSDLDHWKTLDDAGHRIKY